VAPYQACKRSNTPVPKRNGLARREIGAAVALMGRLDQVPNTIENFRYNPIGGIRISADFVKVIECFWSVYALLRDGAVASPAFSPLSVDRPLRRQYPGPCHLIATAIEHFARVYQFVIKTDYRVFDKFAKVAFRHHMPSAPVWLARRGSGALPSFTPYP